MLLDMVQEEDFGHLTWKDGQCRAILNPQCYKRAVYEFGIEKLIIIRLGRQIVIVQGYLAISTVILTNNLHALFYLYNFLFFFFFGARLCATSPLLRHLPPLSSYSSVKSCDQPG